MIIDYQAAVTEMGGIMSLPDYPYGVQGTVPTGEGVIVAGGVGGVSINVTGTVDQSES